MIFSYRAPFRQSGEIAGAFGTATPEAPEAAYGPPRDRPVARLRIEIRAIGGDLVYDAESEVHESIADGTGREEALAALAHATRTVARRVEDSAVALASSRMATSPAGTPSAPHVAAFAAPVPLEVGTPHPAVVDDSSGAARATSMTLLSLVLALGGASVFLGVLALAVTRWSSVGTGGQLGLLGAFTLATFGSGLALGRRGFPRSGLTLEILGLELLWAVAHLALDAEGGRPSTDGWALAAALIGVAHAAHAVKRPSTFVAVSSVFALGVAALTLGVEHSTHAPLGAAIYAGTVAGIFGGIGVLADRLGATVLRRPYAVASSALAFASAVGMTVLLGRDGVGPAMSLEIAWPYLVLGVSFWASRSRVDPTGRLASGTGHAALAVVLPSVQAVLLALGEVPPASVALSVAGISFALALAARRIFSGPSTAEVLASLAAAGWITFSAGLALLGFAQHPGFLAGVWPVALAATAYGASLLASRMEASLASAHLRHAAHLLAIVSTSVLLTLSPWGDTPLVVRGAISLVVTYAMAVLVAHVLDPRGRDAALLFVLPPVAWSLVNTAVAMGELHRSPSFVSAVWPLAVAAFAWAASKVMPRVVPDVAEANPASSFTAPALLERFSALLFLVVPSASVLLVDWSNTAFWVPGSIALVGTAVSAAWVFGGARVELRSGAAPSLLAVTAVLIEGGWALSTLRDAFVEVARRDDYVSVAAAWPFALPAFAFAVGYGLRSSRPSLAVVLRRGAILGLSAAAALLAVVASGRIGFTMLSAIIGIAVARDHLRRSESEGDGVTLALVAGLLSALLPTSLACLRAVFGIGVQELFLPSASGPSPAAHLAVFLAAAAAILVVAFTSERADPALRRGVEVAGVAAFFGVVGLLSLPRLESDFIFSSLLLVGGGAMIAAGLAGRRVVLVTVSVLALVVEFFVQYFAKLHSALHWGLLALGFGLTLLLLAFVFERTVRPRLPELARWG